MSQHPDDLTQGEPPDPDDKTLLSDDVQDLHPAIDPRAAGDTGSSGVHREAPAVDIDEREDASAHHRTPDVIELSDHVDATTGLPASQEIEGNPVETETGQLAADREVLGDTAYQLVSPPEVPRADDPSTSVEDDSGTREDNPPAPSPSVTLTPKPPSRFSSAASRLGLGKLLVTTEDSGEGGGDGANGKTALPGSGSRWAEGVRSYLDPRLHMFSTIPHRRVLAAGIVLTLLCLLANSGGLALIVLSALVPILIVIALTQHDVFEKESNLLIGAVGAGGVAVGIVLALLSAWIQSSQWFDTGVLNFGAAGFGGRFADDAGSAPFIVWSLVGLLIPAVSIAGIAGIPIALRRWPQFRNEVMDGMILAGASAAGFAIGASMVYWWPMIAAPGPLTNVSDWTLSIIGVAILRSAVITLCGAMIGAGIWRYMMTPGASVVVLPAAGGVVGYLLLTFGSIQLQAAGNWPEFIWIALLLVAVFVLYRRVLDGAVSTDRQALGNDQGRLVCPSCHKVTPAGAFCARCGKPLPQPSRKREDVLRNDPVST
ncbi:MAG: hypothetical protein M3490_10890 [Chloroflexota bacterium]|nr:hypothetical protein [Chloroflexota bacterium]